MNKLEIKALNKAWSILNRLAMKYENSEECGISEEIYSALNRACADLNLVTTKKNSVNY